MNKISNAKEVLYDRERKRSATVYEEKDCSPRKIYRNMQVLRVNIYRDRKTQTEIERKRQRETETERHR